MRYLTKQIAQDLETKMVFLAGPRQVGKTTLAFYLLKGNEKHPGYFNWDSKIQRKKILNEELPVDQSLIVLDEIHKYRFWRNLVKGLYDTNKSSIKFLVTGSARLDFYRKGGDSLQGRYHFLRLHPYSWSELIKSEQAKDITLEQLLEFGGFPEPMFKRSKNFWQRWQRDRASQVFQEDLVSVENVKDLSTMQLLNDALPDRVGSPLSINNLAKDLSVAHATVERWVSILENLYVCFRVPPMGYKKLQTMRKEKKLYMWDWSLCESPGARFENFVASHLLKYCHFLQDTQGRNVQLNFLRDRGGKEIDFLITEKSKIIFAVECKTGEKNISDSIKYFSQRTDIPLFYQVHLGRAKTQIASYRARILPFGDFCQEVGLV